MSSSSSSNMKTAELDRMVNCKLKIARTGTIFKVDLKN